MTNSTGAAPARSGRPIIEQTKTIEELRLEQRSTTEGLLESMLRQSQALNERIEVVRQLLVDQGTASTARPSMELALITQNAVTEEIEAGDDYITPEIFRERAVAYLTVNGASPAATIGRECGVGASSATVRMQSLRDKGLVRQNRQTKRWALK